MSYEGINEWITEKGFYLVTGCYDDPPVLEEGDRLSWRHAVDFTNGIEEGSNCADYAKKEMLGHEDVWHTDHYGNKYASKRLKFKPLGKNWQRAK